MDFKYRLKTLRTENHYTQQLMADKLGIAKTTYVKYESGSNEPNLEMIKKITEIFDVSFDYLVGASNLRNFSKLETNTNLSLFQEAMNIVCQNNKDKEEELYSIFANFLSAFTTLSYPFDIDSMQLLLYIFRSLRRNKELVLQSSIEEGVNKKMAEFERLKLQNEFITLTYKYLNLLMNNYSYESKELLFSNLNINYMTDFND